MVRKNVQERAKGNEFHFAERSRFGAVPKYFKALVFEWRLKRAKKKAAGDAALYGKKFLVVVFGGKPVVVSMQAIKKLIRQHRFREGFTAGKAEKCALYVAYTRQLKKAEPCS